MLKRSEESLYWCWSFLISSPHRILAPLSSCGSFIIDHLHTAGLVFCPNIVFFFSVSRHTATYLQVGVYSPAGAVRKSFVLPCHFSPSPQKHHLAPLNPESGQNTDGSGEVSYIIQNVSVLVWHFFQKDGKVFSFPLPPGEFHSDGETWKLKWAVRICERHLGYQCSPWLRTQLKRLS